MDVQRAKEIYQFEGTIPVHLEGDSVWIENVDEANGMATVTVGNNPVNTKTVSVDQLMESKE
ncbi:H-type small acid-soluble spore protein [Paenibacillus sp. J5C_2022]|uniref:H-type small acid-soluble spore protein n=1 Tax=Paenibacillus sp. J5C2022 TaxID=2977129 RepID=UPI0021CEA77C|nr:H-type small acid-soluble spore protein [Paenibacillus sp. J5C2022]MCU6709209.1 H-type small acid-soluble spore protein [Paenibacillus sp. J5C2022]